MTKALLTVLPAALNQVRAGATFLSVKGYTNNYGELSNFGIVFHVDYMKAVKEAVQIWQAHKPADHLEKVALCELIESYQDTLDGRSRSTSAHAYSQVSDGKNIIKGVKYHDREKAIHLYGFLVHKKVIKPIGYLASNMHPKTFAKNKLRKLTRLHRFRQFKLVDGRFDQIGVGKLTLTQKHLTESVWIN